MATSVEELRLDLLELRDLRGRSCRQRVQAQLDLHIRRLETDLAAAEAALATTAAAKSTTAKAASGDSPAYTVEIKTYAWDQSDKYFKLYVSEGLAGVGALGSDRVSAEFTDRSVRLRVLGLGGRDRELSIPRLYERIVPANSSAKVKPDQVVLLLRKAAGSTWAFVTEQEKRLKEKKKTPKPSAADAEDPNAGLMSMMRQMYEDGDDDMKRTIAKAWTESQNKRAAGE